MNTMIKQHIIIKDGKGYLQDYPHLKAYLVAQMHIHGEISVEKVAEHYSIDLADVYAAIAYYYDNQEEIERAIAANIEQAKQVGQDRFREI
jgi:hypothetical protein